MKGGMLMTMELEPFYFRQAGTVVGKSMFEAPPGDGCGDMDAVNAMTLRPFGQEEVAVFTLDLCHNQVDRHHSRFPEEELARINEMTPGRPLMERHDVRGSLPRGTFYRSRLHREAGRVSVRPDVYVLRTADNADFITHIEGGVYRETSIGFSFQTPECSVCGKDLRTCPHVPGREYEGRVCHFIMRGVLEVLEGSVVASGSQGTGFVPREARGNALESLEAARRLYHKPIALWTRPGWRPE